MSHINQKTKQLSKKIEAINETNHLLLDCEKNLKTIQTYFFEKHDTITVFAESSAVKVDGHTDRFNVQGEFAKEIIIELLKDKINKLKQQIKEQQEAL